MEIATVRLVLNKVGSDVPKSNITPAEAMLLHILHGPANGGKTFGEKMDSYVVNGTAMVNTGNTRTVIDSPEQKAEDEVVEEIEIKPAVATVPEKGVAGKPGYVPAVLAIPAEVQRKVIKAAVPYRAAITHEEPILRERTDAEERSRLAKTYGQAMNKKGEPIIDSIWPDKFNPKLPQTFKELKWVEIGQQAAGIEPGQVNYATGKLAQTT